MNLDDFMIPDDFDDIDDPQLNDDNIEDPSGDPTGDTIDGQGGEQEPKDDGIVIDDDAVKYFNFLKENDVILTDDDFEFTGSAEDIQTALHQTKVNLENKIKTEFWEALPDNLKPLLEYTLAGGSDIDEFLNYSKPLDLNNVDISDPISQKLIVKEQWKLTSNFSDDKIEKLISRLEETGSLREAAEEALLEIEEDRKNKQAELLKQAKTKEQEEAQRIENHKKLIETELSTINEQRRQERIKNFILSPIKNEQGFTSEFNLSLTNVLSNPKHLIQLADILADYNSNTGFNFERLKKQFKSEAAKSFRDLLDSKLTTPKSGTPAPSKSNEDFDWDKWMQQ
jgi:hypothetical protein